MTDAGDPPPTDDDGDLFGGLLPEETLDPAARPLPEPGSPELAALKVTGVLADIYRFLYEHRNDEHPPTENEISDYVADVRDDRQSQYGRRKRDLYPLFVITKERIPGSRQPGYRLVGRKDRVPAPDAPKISGRVRAEVLRPGRCYMCGKTPAEDGVKLEVDHKIPQAWGGTDDIDNLQPLCAECNNGKRANFSSFNEHSDKIRLAISQDEPHRRIGELLIAFDGDWVPGSLIEIVASAKQYQEDWQKRTRDLRYLGWKIDFKRSREAGKRTQVSYRAAHWEPLPAGSVGKIVRKIEKDRAVAKRAGQSVSPDDTDSGS